MALPNESITAVSNAPATLLTGLNSHPPTSQSISVTTTEVTGSLSTTYSTSCSTPPKSLTWEEKVALASTQFNDSDLEPCRFTCLEILNIEIPLYVRIMTLHCLSQCSSQARLEEGPYVGVRTARNDYLCSRLELDESRKLCERFFAEAKTDEKRKLAVELQSRTESLWMQNERRMPSGMFDAEMESREQRAREKAAGKRRWKSIKWRKMDWNPPARSGIDSAASQSPTSLRSVCYASHPASRPREILKKLNEFLKVDRFRHQSSSFRDIVSWREILSRLRHRRHRANTPKDVSPSSSRCEN